MADLEPAAIPGLVAATQPVVVISKRTARAWLLVLALVALSALFGVIGLVSQTRSLQKTVTANRVIIEQAEQQIDQLTDKLDCRSRITATNVAANGQMLDLLALAVIDLINGERAAIKGLVDQFETTRRLLAESTTQILSNICD